MALEKGLSGYPGVKWRCGSLCQSQIARGGHSKKSNANTSDNQRVIKFLGIP